MKKNLISMFALLLALASLVLSIFAYRTAKDAWGRYEHYMISQAEENELLHSRIDTLLARLEGMESGTVMSACNLFVDSWVEEGGALTLTSAYMEVQLSAEITIETAQLVLLHNGSESSRVEIFLDNTEIPGVYSRSLTDTWFILPEMADDDALELYLEVTLSTGEQMVSASTGWFRTDGTLHSVVG